jgi:hypothetical protein
LALLGSVWDFPLPARGLLRAELVVAGFVKGIVADEFRF